MIVSQFPGYNIPQPKHKEEVLLLINNLAFISSSWLPRWFSGKGSSNARDVSSIPGSEDPLEKEIGIHSSILALEIPWTEGLVEWSMGGSQKNLTQLSD